MTITVTATSLDPLTTRSSGWHSGCISTRAGGTKKMNYYMALIGMATILTALVQVACA